MKKQNAGRLYRNKAFTPACIFIVPQDCSDIAGTKLKFKCQETARLLHIVRTAFRVLIFDTSHTRRKKYVF